MARGCRTRHERSRGERHQQPGGIRNGVRRIGQQGETSGDQRANRLRQHNNDRQAKGNQKTRTHRSGILRTRNVRMVVMMTVVVSVCVLSHEPLLEMWLV